MPPPPVQREVATCTRVLCPAEPLRRRDTCPPRQTARRPLPPRQPQAAPAEDQTALPHRRVCGTLSLVFGSKLPSVRSGSTHLISRRSGKHSSSRCAG